MTFRDPCDVIHLRAWQADRRGACVTKILWVTLLFECTYLPHQDRNSPLIDIHLEAQTMHARTEFNLQVILHFCPTPGTQIFGAL